MKHLTAGIAAGFLLFSSSTAAWAQTSAPPAAPGNVIQATLANGMRVVLLPNRLAPVATTVMTYGAGSNDDTVPGIAHATEHMMFRGTKFVPAAQFAILAARAGADYNAETNEVFTRYYFELPSAYTGLALKLEADRMTSALMSDAAWQTERGAIEQEVRAHQSVPGADIDMKVRRAFFGDTPYAHPGVGTIEGFQRMRASDIARFYQAWYHPNNATLIVAGDIDTDAVLAEIRADFEAIPSVPLPVRKPFSLQPITGTTEHDTIGEIPIPIGAMMYRFPDLLAPDFAAGQVLAAVFNSGRGAFADLQAKGQVLGGFASAGAYRDTGAISLAAFGFPGEPADTVQSTLNGVIDAYRTNGVPADLVAAAKTRLLSQQDYRQESIMGLAFVWSQWLAVGDVSPDAIHAEYANVTVDDVNRVLRTYLDPKLGLGVIITPKSTTAVPHIDPQAGVEDVKFTVEHEQPLPAWSLPYFRADLKVPQSDSQVAVYRLPNGLTLTVRPEHAAPTVSLQGEILTAPDLYEPRGKDGVASITDTLLPWGTTTYDRSAYQAQFDAIAASAKLGSTFSEDMQSVNFDRAIELLADGLLHPAFAAQAFAVVKANSVKTAAAVEHLPRTQTAIARLDALYPAGDPRRRRSTAGTISAIGLNDVKHWHTFAFRPDLTTIAIVGDVTPVHARSVIAKYFGAWRATDRKPSFAYPVIPSKKKQASVTIASPSSTHSEVTLTQILNVRSGNADAIALSLANTMLSGEGIGSMLFRDMREKRGYVYDVDSSIDLGNTTSTFSIEFSADPHNVSRAQAVALSDVRRLQQTLVPDVELQRAKALLLAQRVLPLDSYDGIATEALASAEAGLTPADEDLYWRRLLSTTPAQVRNAMRRWIKAGSFSRVILAPGS